MAKITPITPVKSMGELVAEYDSLRAKKKAIDERMKVLAKDIKDFATLNGNKDDKGSYYVEDDKYVFGSQCKKSIKLNDEKVLNYFKAHHLDAHIETKEFVPEKTVEYLNNDGTISYEDLETLVDVKETYSVTVVNKEEVTAEVQEHTVQKAEMPIAASKKPVPKLRKRK